MGILQAAFDVEAKVRQQIHLVEEHEPCRPEHVGILERLVFALGDREHDDLRRLAEIEAGWTNQVSDVFDEQHAVIGDVETIKRSSYHAGIQMAALSGVDLQGRCAGGANAVGIMRGLLVALDDRRRNPTLERLDRAHQQRRLARAGTGYKIQCENPAVSEELAVLRGVPIVLREDVLLDLHHARLAHARCMRTGRAETIVHAALPAFRGLAPWPIVERALVRVRVSPMMDVQVRVHRAVPMAVLVRVRRRVFMDMVTTMIVLMAVPDSIGVLVPVFVSMRVRVFAFMGMQVAMHSAVFMFMLVLVHALVGVFVLADVGVRVCMYRPVCVPVLVGMRLLGSVIELAAQMIVSVALPGAVGLQVPGLMSVIMIIELRSFRVMSMDVAMGRSVRMDMLVLVACIAFHADLAGAAAAGRAHYCLPPK